MKTCVFAGTFDPFTKGHEYVVNKCLDIFDKVVIAVGVNVSKQPYFDLEERIEIIKNIFNGNDKIEICSYSGMLVDFMRDKGVVTTVRGIRNQDDYKYETTMAQYNQDMYPECITLYIPTPLSLAHVSSSAMRNIISLKGDISPYVPKNSVELINKIIKEKSK
jgi:pantetheine-phosphate adenylyltransferase